MSYNDEALLLLLYHYESDCTSIDGDNESHVEKFIICRFIRGTTPHQGSRSSDTVYNIDVTAATTVLCSTISEGFTRNAVQIWSRQAR